VIITAQKSVSGAPVFVQLFNNSDSIVDMRGWKLELIATNTTNEVDVTLAAFSAWLLPRGYVVAGDNSITGADAVFQLDSATKQALATMTDEDFKIIPSSTATTTNDFDVNAATKWSSCNSGAGTCSSCTSASSAALLTPGQWLQRKLSTSGKYTVSTPPSPGDFCTQNGAATLTGDGLYQPPIDTAGLQIVELLPNAQNCSPTNTSLLCGDYVKLFNATNKPVDLSAYRLRTSYDGTKSSSSNTITLNGLLAPGAYTLVNTKNDGTPLSLTESGGYVWLEDTYGMQIYQPVVQYPDASSTTKVGWAWALGGSTWGWTSSPQPTGANYFPPESPTNTTSSSTATLVPCKPGQERNPLTNRCRTIVSAATLVPCKPDQTRNPATNRCRSLLATSTLSLTPCKAGQQRNPATNRCRAVLGASTTLKPCAAGQARNPATNRCRKVTAASIANIQDVKAATTASSAHWQWFIAAAVVLAALGYAFYEWRQDILLALNTARSKLSTIKSSRQILKRSIQIAKSKK
jgi:hypothetical protein